MKLWLLLPGLIVLLVSSLPVSASVTAMRLYRLGEIDPGAADGVIATYTLDSAGTNHFVVLGSPTYSANVPANNVTPTTLAMKFTGTNYASAAAFTNLTDNFGLELWVKPSVISGTHCLAYNGITGSNGWGLYQKDSTFQALFGGVVFFGSAPVVTNAWTHLALVRASGTATLYMNGLAVTTSSAVPNLPSGFFALGCAPAAFNAEFFDGLIDELRAFTFAPGAFAASDLTFSPPEDRTLSILRRDGDTIELTWSVTNVALRLQSTTNLTTPDWLPVPNSYDAGLFRATNTIANPAQFYRLITACDTNGYITMSAFRKVNNNQPQALARNPASTDQLIIFNSITLNNNSETTFDFSQAINPRTCSTNGLIFKWMIDYSNPEVPTPYTCAGITGYNSPVLRISPNSMINTGPGETALLELTIEDPANPDPERIVRCEIPIAMVRQSALTLSQFSICQTETNACPTCPCINPQALPATP